MTLYGHRIAEFKYI